MGEAHAWLGQVHAFEAQERIIMRWPAIRDQQLLKRPRHLGSGRRQAGKTGCSESGLQPAFQLWQPGARKSSNNEDIGQPVSYDKSDTYEVPMITLDDVKLSQVDFIKIDVEGMEIDVLRGATKILKSIAR